MNKVYLGKFVSTHGLNGELKLVSDFDKKNLVYKKDFPLIIENKTYHIASARPHKIYELIALQDYEDINKVDNFINKDVYINYEDLDLKDNEYLMTELLDAKIIENNKEIGKVTEIVKGVKCDYIKLNDNYLIPLMDQYIKSFDKKGKVLYTNGTEMFNLK